jgi:group I intron endonuclease
MKFSDLKCPAIYKITNTVTGKIYVGKAINFFNRYKYYKYNFRYKRMYIYRAMAKYGFDKFKFEVLEVCSVDNLIEREIYWITILNSNSRDIGYNLRTDSKENSGFYHTEETKQKLSEFFKGRKPWHAGKSGLPCYRSTEALQKFSERMTGGNNPNAKKVFQYDLNMNFIKEHESVSGAARDLNIVFQGIARCASGERKTYKNYIWKYSPL